MKIYKCLIIEDSIESSVILVEYLKQLTYFETKVAFTYQEAFTLINEGTFDIIFLDIQINGQSGLELIRRLANLPPVIITSAYPEFAIETYEVESIVDFLMKPYSRVRLEKALHKTLGNRFVKGALLDQNFVFLRVSRKAQRFDFKDIDYIQAYGVYSKIYYGGASILVNEPIASLQNLLPSTVFRRVHKSYILNLSKITGLDHRCFFIDKNEIPIGVSYRPYLDGLFRLFASSDDKE